MRPGDRKPIIYSLRKIHPIGQEAVSESALVTPVVLVAEAAPRPKHPIGSGADRRTRVRAKFSGRVHIRGGMGTLDAFEDMGRSVDATRDGLLFMSPRGGYWVGQVLQVAFPYWTVPSAINVARPAKVVRNSLLPDFRYAVAVQFEQPRGAEAPWLQPNASQIRVLGVEPDAAMAEATIKLLEQDGYKVVIVRTAQQALDILENDTPDVILAQAEGGVVSGKDLCTIVKRNLRLQHIPVILLTTSACLRIIRRAIGRAQSSACGRPAIRSGCSKRCIWLRRRRGIGRSTARDSTCLRSCERRSARGRRSVKRGIRTKDCRAIEVLPLAPVRREGFFLDFSRLEPAFRPWPFRESAAARDAA